MAQNWYVQYNDRIEGPLSAKALRSRAKSGQLSPEQLVSLDQSNWFKAGKLKELPFVLAAETSQPSASIDTKVIDSTANKSSSLNLSLPSELSRSGVSVFPSTELADPIDQQIRLYLDNPDKLVPGYTIDGVLGRGAMGVVYRAHQAMLGRHVAIKTVLLSQLSRKDGIPRFEREARTVAKLHHPNVVAAFDFGRNGDSLYLVLEYLDGETLEELLLREGRIAEEKAWGLARQAAAGLAHAAENQIVHRDVKPANLFLTKPPAGFPLPDGMPLLKITDFGVAFLRGEQSSGGPRLTVAGVSLGTPLYMAPEQLANDDVDHRADIYALGLTTYRMIAGRLPFDAENFMQMMVRKATGDIPRLDAYVPGTSRVSAELIQSMLVADPNKRIGDYRELISRVDEAIAAPKTTVAPRMQTPSGKFPPPAPVQAPNPTQTIDFKNNQALIYTAIIVGGLVVSLLLLMLLRLAS